MNKKNLKNILAKDIMKSGNIITVKPGMLARDVSNLFAEKNISGAPVVNDDDELIGVVSLTDIARSEAIIDLKSVLELIFFNASDEVKKEVEEHLQDNHSELDVYYIMTPHVITVEPEAELEKIISLFLEHKIHRLFVTENKKIVGVLTVTDLLKLILIQ